MNSPTRALSRSPSYSATLIRAEAIEAIGYGERQWQTFDTPWERRHLLVLAPARGRLAVRLQVFVSPLPNEGITRTSRSSRAFAL